MSEVQGVHITTATGTTAFIPCVPGLTSDGFHTVDELYNHRNLLFCAMLRMYGGWKSRFHDDGSAYVGWFIAGMNLGGQPITYHLPDAMWPLCSVMAIPKAPAFDGHTSQDVAARIRAWLVGDPSARHGQHTVPGVNVNSYRGQDWYQPEEGDRP